MADGYDVVVVGAGQNGLVAAGYLAGAGRRVLVVEKRGVPGGMAAGDGRFPGAEHRLGWLAPRIVRDLDLERHGLALAPADPALVALQPGAEPLLLWRDPARTAEGLGRFSPADARRWPAFVAWVARVARLLRAVYLDAPPRPTGKSVAELLSLGSVAARLRLMGRKEMVELVRVLPMPAADLLDEWFESPALKGALGWLAVRGSALGPRAGGTAFLLLHHLVATQPAAFDAGSPLPAGAGGPVEVLAAALRARGGELRTGAEVERIVVRDGRATGVVLTTGHEIEARRVVSGVDPRRTLTALVEPVHLEAEFLRRVCSLRFRGAAARVNLVTAGAPRLALPGSLLVYSPGLDFVDEAQREARYGRMSRSPALELVVPPADPPAPAGRGLPAPPESHVLSALVQYAPYGLAEGAWDEARREALGQVVVDTLARLAPDLPGAVVHRQVLSPVDLEQGYGLTEGSLSHGEMALDQLLFMRPVPGWGHYRTPIEGLYLCGPGTHPGGGVTGAPGHNAARLILRERI